MAERIIKFSKMVATGNDFIIIDNRSLSLMAHSPSAAKKLCDRRFGVGADSLLLVEKSKIANFKMRIFNPDSSEAEMCGNGARCAALYAKTNSIATANMTIETKAGILSAKVKANMAKLNMTEPKGIKLGIDIEVDGKSYQLHFVNTGVPHAVSFCDNLDNIDVAALGNQMRHHRVFSPAGTNVNFVKISAKNKLFMRTYERGVEGETYACGTGAVASAIISSIIKGFNSPVKVNTKGGVLTIYFKKKGNRFTNVFLEGEAKEVFKGKLKISV